MKKILLVSRRDDRPDYDTASSMVKALQQDRPSSEIEYGYSFLEDIAFIYDGQRLLVQDIRTGQDLSEYDGVFLLGWFKLRRHEDVALALGLYMKSLGKKVLNSEAINNRSRSKISQYVLCVINDIKTVPFAVVGDVGENQQLLKIYEQAHLDFPMIVKSVTASRGRDNYLVKNAEELKAAMMSSPTKALIAQNFVANDGDYRLLVMGDEVRLAIHRQAASDTHVNNTSQGGVAKAVALETLDQKMLEEAVTIAQLLKREVTGVDMIIDRNTGAYYFLEANNMPQLSTGSLVDQKMAVLNSFLHSWIN